MNNAGRQPRLLDREFDATLKANSDAPFWLIKAALLHLQPGACIIATTSEQAYETHPGLVSKVATMTS